MTPRRVTVIPPTLNLLTKAPTGTVKKRRTAGYARVSTDSDEQFTSYEAQIDYYTQYIKRHSDWEFVKVYTDEGITGTNTKRRDGFKEMIKDALDGKIDLIVTKSISRFARNTVDTLVNVRKLKEHGVEVFFEKENIYTFDSKGELLITIMSSLAQEESRSISENVTWGQRKRFADGKVSLPYKQFLGYRKGADGIPEIVPEEAEIVRSIYKMFINGLTPGAIAKELIAQGIPTPSGKKGWQYGTVNSILHNEKYKGDARLQKCFTVDFLTKKTKINEGEVPQYYVENSHPAIIPPDEWELVQRETERRKKLGGRYRSNDILCCRIVCGDCGTFYGSKVWHSTDKYRRVIWQCNAKYKYNCNTPKYDDDTIKKGFINALNQLISDKDNILDDCRIIQKTLTDCSEIDRKLETALQEIEVVTELTKKCINENSTNAQNQEAFASKYNSLVQRYETEKNKVDELNALKLERQHKADEIGAFMFRIHELDTIEEFDSTVWIATIDRVIANADGSLVYCFLNGAQIKV